MIAIHITSCLKTKSLSLYQSSLSCFLTIQAFTRASQLDCEILWVIQVCVLVDCVLLFTIAPVLVACVCLICKLFVQRISRYLTASTYSFHAEFFVRLAFRLSKTISGETYQYLLYHNAIIQDNIGAENDVQSFRL